MTTIVRMAPSAALEAFRQWVALALPTLSEVVLAKQDKADASRAALPYATVERTRLTDLASPYRRVGGTKAGGPTGETNELELTQVKDLIVMLSIYGDDGPDLLDLLPMAHGRTESQALLETAGIAVRELGDAQNTRELRSTVHEASAFQEFAVTFCREDSSTVGTIETAEIMGYDAIPTE